MKGRFLPILLFAITAFGQNQGDVLTTEAVVKMVQAGVPTQTIIRTIASADKVSFNMMEYEAMVRAGINDDVFKAMAAKSAGHPIPGLAAPPQPPPPPQIERRREQSTPPQTRSMPQAGNQRISNPNEYQGRGMWDLDISGFAIIPHTAPSSTVGLVQAEAGYFVSRGWLIGGGVTGVFNRDTQDVFLNGGARYFFKTRNPRILPYLGASAGVNILNVSGFSDSRFLAQGGGGLRCFVARHVAIDIGYTLEYIHLQDASFGDSTASAITVGFAHVFGGR
jgi:hypothetical protein